MIFSSFQIGKKLENFYFRLFLIEWLKNMVNLFWGNHFNNNTILVGLYGKCISVQIKKGY
jgi:hypothetical protein